MTAQTPNFGWRPLRLLASAFLIFLFNTGDASAQSFGTEIVDPIPGESARLVVGANVDGIGGIDDIVMVSTTNLSPRQERIKIFRANSGSSTYNLQLDWPLGMDDRVTCLSTGDANADGIDEIVFGIEDATSSSPPILLVWAGDSTGSPTQLFLNLFGGPGTPGPTDCAIADVHPSPGKELISIDQSVFTNLQVRRYQSPTLPMFPSGGEPFITAIIAADAEFLAFGNLRAGTTENEFIVSQNGSQWIAYSWNGTAFDPYFASASTDDTYENFIVDIDNAGDVDVLELNRTGNELGLWNQLSPGLFMTTVALPPPATLTSRAGVQYDFDSDGFPEIIRVGDPSNILMYDMFDGSETPWGSVRSYQDVTLVDGNFDGVMDVLALEAGSPNGSLVLLPSVAGSCTKDSMCPAEEFCRAGACTPRHGLAAPTNVVSLPCEPTDFYTADVDFDEILDIVVSCSDMANFFQVFKGDGSGAANLIQTVPNSFGASAIVMGDVDGDGDSDLVVGTRLGGTPGFRYYKNSGGAFAFEQEVTTLDAIGGISDLELGDVDQDGDLDLFVAQDIGGFSIYRNNQGVFSTSSTFFASATRTDPQIALGNVDGDTNDLIDVVIGSNDAGPGVLSLYRDFDLATFSYDVRVDESPAVTEYISDIKLGDRALGSPGKLDIVFSAFGSVFSGGTATYNAGALSVNAGLFATGDATAVELGDFDGDGALEAAIANDGFGEVALVESFMAGGVLLENYVGPEDVREMIFTDFDNDGSGDLLMLRRTGATGTIDLYSGINPNLHSSYENFGDLVSEQNRVEAADIDGDGLTDIITQCDNPSPVPFACNIYFRSGGASIAGAQTLSGIGDAASMAVGDITSDNRLDIMYTMEASTSSEWFRNVSPPVWTSNFLAVPSTNQYLRTKLADYNQDGALDLFATYGTELVVFDGNGDGTFDAPQTIDANGGGEALEVGDLDNDGNLDVVYYNIVSDRIATALYSGSWITNDTSISTPFFPTDYELLDVDDNGILDLAYTDKGGPTCVFRGDGAGDFVTQFWCSNGTVNEQVEYSTGLDSGDVNGDGFLDLVVASQSSDYPGVPNGAPVRLYLGDASSTYTLAWTIARPANPSDVALLDFDADSDLDVVVTNRSITGYEDSAHVFFNTRFSPETLATDKDRRPDNPTTVKVLRPLAPFGEATPGQAVRHGDIDFEIRLRDFESDPATVRVEFSINRGTWLPATITSPVSLENLASSRAGLSHTLTWDAVSDGGLGQDIRLRVSVIRQQPGFIAAPIRHGLITDVSAPFNVSDPCIPDPCGADLCVEGACFTNCTTNAMCGAGSCYVPNGQCAPSTGLGACSTVTCASGQSCHGGQCYPDCSSDGDCTPPNLCFDGRCALSACDGVSCPVGDLCVGGSCRTPCGMDSDCGGTPCVSNGGSGFCELAAGPCDGVDCPSTETCIEGGCFAVCSNNSDCPPVGEEACYPLPVDGASRGCSSQDDPCKDIVCPIGEACVEGACFQACSVSGDCTVDPTHVCYDATYCNDPLDACSNISCPSGYSCYQGACYPFCTDTGDCSPPNVCHENACVSGLDPCEYVDCAEGDACYQGSCFPECSTNADCSPPFSVCFDATVCQDTFDPCNGVVCPAGETCHEGLCFQSCSAGDPCSTPQVCYQDYCNTAGDPCDGVQCPSGETCWEGGCFETCSVMSDCTTPTQCFEDPVAGATTERCVYDGCDGIACPLGEVCYQGGCYDDCSSGTCDNPLEVCYDASRCATSACDRVECPVGQVCYQGSCVTECSANAECPGYIGGVGFVDVGGSTNLAVSSGKSAGATMGDIDLDGDLDAVANTNSQGTRLSLHDGSFPDPIYSDNTATTAESLYSPDRERSVVLGDFTGDGYLDVARNTSGAITVSENAGASPWYPNSLRTHYTASSPTSTYSYNTEGLAWIDYDGDGDLDLMAQNQDESVVILENDPEGSLTQLTEAQVNAIGFTDDANGDFMATGDLEPDGDVDVLLRMPGTSTPDLYINNGDGTFTASGSFNADADSFKGGTEFCDLDNDGDLDILWVEQPLNIWENDGAGGWINTGEPLSSAGVGDPSNGQGVGCGDFDNDGDLDIYVSRDADDLVFENRSTPGTWDFIQNQFGVAGPNDSEATHMADYDRSGSLDIWVNRDGGNYMWENTREDAHYLAITPLIDLGGGNFRNAVGATVVIRDPDGNILGTRAAGNAKGQGGQQAMTIHYGLPYGPNVPYDLEVIYPGDVRTRVCVVPFLTGSYQEVTVADTDTNDRSACIYATGWTALIDPPSGGDFCFDGRCAADSCDGVQCPAGDVCYGGNCKVDCSTGTPCPSGETCVGGACVDSGDPDCDGDTFVCQLGYSCVGGDCLPLCTGDSDCASGQYCYQGVCTPDSCASVTCPSSDVCYRGVCFEDCSASGTMGTCSTSGESCFEGRCATDGCAALTDNYDSGFIYRDTGRRLYANQVSSPFFWPRPVEGAVGVSASAWLGFSAGSVSGDARPPERTARVYMYLDETAQDGNNGLGRYALWLATGADGPACATLGTPLSCNADTRCAWNTIGLTCERAEAGPTATYRIRIKDPGSTPQVLLNDDNEGVRIIKPYSSPDEWVVTTQVTNAADTGGMLIGYLDASENRDWVVQIDAGFSGGIDTWEFYSPEGYHVPLDPGQVLTLKSFSNVSTYRFTPDAGIPCSSDPINPTPDGICAKGTSWCESGTMRCEFTVQPWDFEVCDGLDNDCDSFVDNDVHVPEVEWRQGSGSSWVKWITYDTTTSAASILNFTPRAGDDRVGTVDILDVDGMPLQAADRQVLAMHRNLRSGELNMALAGSRLTTGTAADSFSDRPMDMRMKFPGSSNTVEEMFVSWWDDRETEAGATPPVDWDGGTVQDEIIEWEERSRFDLEWELEKDGSGTTAVREADAALMKAMWGGHSNDFKEHLSRLEWQDADDEDDLGDEILDWKLYSPRQAINDIKQWQDLRTRIEAVPLSDSTCDAGTTVSGCSYARYTCRSGQLGCGVPTLAVCNDCEDLDGDGFFAYDPATCISGRDCDDDNADINPGEPEYCNGYDDDCDGRDDIKDDAAYMALWGEARPTGSATCDSGGECGPEECAFRFACVCPDGPEDPLNPPPADGGTGPACECSEGLAPPAPNMSLAPDEPNAPEERPFEDPDAACSAAGGSTLPPLLLILGWTMALLRKRQ